MKSIVFLFLRTIKNQLLDLKRKPGKLVMYGIVVAFLILVILMSALSDEKGTSESYTDILWLKGGEFALFAVFFLIALRQGLSQGSTFFSMKDVNFLFVSPVSTGAILLKGVIRLLGTAAVVSVFILFQSQTLKNVFGIGLNGAFVLFAGYVLFFIVIQIFAMFIYSVAAGNKRKKLWVKILAFLMFVPLGVTAVWQMQTAGGDYMAGVLELLGSPTVSFMPFIGWASAGSIAFIAGDYLAGTMFFSLLIGLGALFIWAMYASKQNYYEDVLVAAETTFEMKRNMTEGRIDFASAPNKRIRVENTGVGGLGASALFYKHIRESFRVNRFGLWGISTVVMTGGVVVLAVFMREIAKEPGSIMLTLLSVAMGMQVFLIGLGRGLKETYNYYIYMIPENPLAKLVWSNMEHMLKVVVESVLIFGIAGLVAGQSVLLMVAAMLVYILFSFLLVAVNFVFIRFTGADMSAGILVVLYMLVVTVAIVPGVAGAVLVGVMIDGLMPGGWGFLAALGILSAWELLLGMVCFAAAKGILHNCDMPDMSMLTQNRKGRV